MKMEVQRKILVILPTEDVKGIEEQVRRGRYVTKSDFFRSAVKRLLYSEAGFEKHDIVQQGQNAAQMLTRMQVLNTLKARRAEINDIGIRKIGLFGSYARNEQTAESDIDILVEFSKGRKNFHNYMRLKLFLERTFRKKVDVVIKDALRQELKQNIMDSVVYA